MNVFVSQTCYRQVYGTVKGSSTRRVEDFNRLVERLQQARTRDDLQVKGLGTKKYRSVGGDVYGVDLNNGLTAERVIFTFLDASDPRAQEAFGRYMRPGQVQTVLLCYCSEHDSQHRHAVQVARGLASGKAEPIADVLGDAQAAELARIQAFEVPWRTFGEGDLERYGAPRTPVLTQDKFRIVGDFMAFEGPMLVTGAAGSGKTELGLRIIEEVCAAQPAGKPARILYTTVSQRLLAEVESRLSHAARACCELLTYDALLRSLAGGQGVRFASRRTFLAFVSALRARPAMCGKDRAAILRLVDGHGEGCVYAELYGVVFGGMGPGWDRLAHPGQPEACEMLCEADYLRLGSDVGYLSDTGLRRSAYAAARHYTKWLRAAGVSSRNALAARLAVRGRLRPYDLVVADEVQDLSEVQVELLARLARAREGAAARLFMTGDVNQVLAPTAWSARRYLRMDRALLSERLEGNFRNPKAVCEVGNGVGRLRTASPRLPRRRLPEMDLEASHNRAAGRVSWCVCDDEDLLVQMADEAANVALVCDGASYTRLAPKSASVFTVEQIKGMEFANVILYGLFATQAPALEALFAPGPKDASLHRCLNLLYVGVTRASANLLVVEAADSPSLERFVQACPHLERVGHPREAGFDLDASALGYYRVACELKEQGAYASARDNFTRALGVGQDAAGGALDPGLRARARRLMRVCDIYLGLGEDFDDGRAMLAFEAAGLYEQAAPHARAALDDVHVCLLALAADRDLDGAHFGPVARAENFQEALARTGVDLGRLFGVSPAFDRLLDEYLQGLADEMDILALETQEHVGKVLAALGGMFRPGKDGL